MAIVANSLLINWDIQREVKAKKLSVNWNILNIINGVDLNINWDIVNNVSNPLNVNWDIERITTIGSGIRIYTYPKIDRVHMHNQELQ